MFASVPAAIVQGVEGHRVRVEVHSGRGLPGLSIVGLPDASCREARDRVRAAVLASDAPWPTTRLTINLAPSATRKPGSGMDLAMAVGVLVASGHLRPDQVAGLGFIGELGLDGSVRSVAGTVPLVDAIECEAVVVPVSAADDASLVGGPRVHPVRTLREVLAVLGGEATWVDHAPSEQATPVERFGDLADVRGQPVIRAALEIAAAGGHHLLMIGPPGAGKTMLAKRLPGLLPPLDRASALEVSRIYSASGRSLAGGLVRRPPLRAPHHASTVVSLVGGGTDSLRPGELSLAHGGVLFLDELGEFAPAVLDALRQPLEEGVIRVSRARFTVSLPARVQLVAAMNPCPCGESGRPGACSCTDAQLARYRRRLSGPLLDRFDLRVDVMRPIISDLLGGERGESSDAVAKRVAKARLVAEGRGVRTNAELRGEALESFAPLSADARTLLESALETNRLSARGLDRVRRVALTIADLAGQPGLLTPELVATALSLRGQLRARSEVRA